MLDWQPFRRATAFYTISQPFLTHWRLTAMKAARDNHGQCQSNRIKSVTTEQPLIQYRAPSRAKVLQFARSVFRTETATDSEQVNAFAAALQALLAAYMQVRNTTRHADQP